MTTRHRTSEADVHLLPRPEGRIAYTDQGSGPLVVATPGMGDLRSTYRDLIDPLLAAGYRVVVADLRGHGDSDTSFRTHGDIATGQDLLALVEHLGGPAVLVGNSMGAAAAAWAAAERPDLVAGLVLLAPLLRERSTSTTGRALFHLVYRLAFARPWGASFWARYYRSLHRGTQPAGLDEHADAIRENLREPGRLRAFRTLALQLDHSVVEPRLGDVTAPTLAFVGTLDPDFRDPAAELDWIADVLHATPVLLPDVGHYPQSQRPDVVVPAVTELLAGLPRTADRWTVAPRG